MKTARALVVLAAALAVPLVTARTPAEEPAKPAAADAGADAGTDADAEAGPDLGQPLPVFDTVEAFPDKPSPMPKDSEWKSAREVTIHRWKENIFASHEKSPWHRCHAYRVREWVRVDCSLEGGVLLLGGNVDGLTLREGSATFPVRVGDRRELEFLDTDTLSFFHGTQEVRLSKFSFVLSEQWIAGDAHPVIVAD